MASGLFKVTVVQYWLRDCWVGPDGRPCENDAPGARFVRARKVPKGTPGAKKVKKKSGKWYGRVPGSPKAVPLSANKVAAQQLLAALVRKAELGRAGICDPFEEHRKRPLVEHLAEWEEVLKARNNSPKHVAMKVSQARKIIDACRFTFIGDLSASRVEAALAGAGAGRDRRAPAQRAGQGGLDPARAGRRRRAEPAQHPELGTRKD